VTPEDHLHLVDPVGPPLGGLAPPEMPLVEPEVEILDEALDLFTALVRNQLMEESSLLARAVEAQQTHAYAVALTSTWSVVERLTYRLWDRYVAANRRRPLPQGIIAGESWVGATPEQAQETRTDYEFIDQTRLSFLKNKEQFSAAVASDVLSLLDEVLIDAYRAMTRARKARNDWLHKLKAVDNLDSEAAFDAVSALLDALYGIKFELRVGGSLTGFTDEEIRRAQARLVANQLDPGAPTPTQKGD